MTVKEAIVKADALRPNAYGDEIKTEWVYQLEAEFADLMGQEYPDKDLPNGDDEQLLMPYPRDNVYPLYLCAMIDFANQETALYQNDMAMANAAISEAKAWYRRNNRPKCGRGWRVMR